MSKLLKLFRPIWKTPKQEKEVQKPIRTEKEQKKDDSQLKSELERVKKYADELKRVMNYIIDEAKKEGITLRSCSINPPVFSPFYGGTIRWRDVEKKFTDLTTDQILELIKTNKDRILAGSFEYEYHGSIYNLWLVLSLKDLTKVAILI